MLLPVPHCIGCLVCLHHVGCVLNHIYTMLCVYQLYIIFGICAVMFISCCVCVSCQYCIVFLLWACTVLYVYCCIYSILCMYHMANPHCMSHSYATLCVCVMWCVYTALCVCLWLSLFLGAGVEISTHILCLLAPQPC